MQNFKAALLLFLFGIISAQFSQAQVPSYNEVGYKPFGSYDGSNVDQVNLDNLNLSLDIPLFSLPQRGRLALSYSLPYTNWGYQQTAICVMVGTHNNCSYRISPGVGMSLGPTFDQSVLVVATTSDTGQQANLGNGLTAEYYTVNYVLYDSHGGQHVLLYENGGFRAADGSGWLFTPSGSNQDNPFATGPSIVSPPGVAIDSQGTRYTFTVPSGAGNASLTSIQDADGNVINLSTGYDSFGRSLAIGVSSASVSSCPTLTAQYQPVTSATTWTVPGPNGGTATYTFCYTTISIHTDFLGGSTSGTFEDFQGTQGRLQSVVLPNNTYWGFVYDAANPSDTSAIAYGDLLQLTLPTGGAISYLWQTLPVCTPEVNIASNGSVYPWTRSLVSRTVNPGAGQPSSLWQYGITTTNSVGTTSSSPASTISPAIGTQYSTVIANPDGSQVVHGFTDYSKTAACSLYETATQYGTPVNGSMTLTKTVATQYQAPTSYYPATMPAPLPVQTTETWPNGQSSYSTKAYDIGYPTTNQMCYMQTNDTWYCIVSGGGNVPLGKVISTSDYDFSGALLRQTSTSYLWQTQSAYLSANLLDTPSQVTISPAYGGSGPAAQTNYTYDVASQVGLTPTTALPANGYSTPPGTVFGHVTSATDWLNEGGSSPITYTYWLKTGKVDHTIDARGNTTSYTYDSTGNFPSQVVHPATGSVTHQEWFVFDPNVGRPTHHTDENGSAANDPKHTTIYSYDSFGSLIGEANPDGGGLSINYNGYANPLTINTTITNGYQGTWPVSNSITAVSDPNQETSVIYDGIGRVSQKIVLVGTSSPLNTVTTYDNMDRVYSVTNPYFTTGDSTYGKTDFTYDVLNRKLLQTNSDSTTESWSYSGSTVTFTDENLNQWQRTSDALGRLTTVLEPNGVSTAPSMETDYNYDALGNLWFLNQWGGHNGASGAISRSFSYDSLSRLFTSTNPEPGFVSYSYDANSNLLTKTSPAVNATSGTQTIGYCYDALNRLVGKSNTTPPANCTSASAIPAANLLDSYTFDASGLSGASNDIGRLTDEKAYSGGTLIAERSPYAYDSMGRELNEQQCATANCAGAWYTPAYTYDLAGNIATGTVGLSSATASGIPSSTMQFLYGYDSGNRLTGVTSTIPESTNYPSIIFQPTSYGPIGLTNASLGVNVSKGTSAAALLRAYDKRQRVLSETDTASVAEQVTPAATSTAAITVSGTEAAPFITVAATPGTGSLTITGSDGTYQVCTITHPTLPGGELGPPVTTCTNVPDTGTLSATIDGFTASASYGSGTADSTIASTLASGFSASGSPVTVGYPSGGATNLVPDSLQVGGNLWNGYCSASTFTNMTLNTTAVIAPDGSQTATQFVMPSTFSCGAGGAFGALTQISGGLTAGDTYTVSAWLRGANGGEQVIWGLNDCLNAPLTLTNSWQRYTQTFTSISSSSATCADGSRGFEFISYSPNATYYIWGAQTVQASTAGPYVPTTNGPVTVSASNTLYLTAKATGTASNYPITISNGGGYTLSDPGAALGGGLNAGTVYDAGAAMVTIEDNGTAYSATANWGQGSTAASLASSLASAISTAAGSIVTVTTNGSTVNLTSKGTGPTVNYAVSTAVTDSETVSYPTQFPSPSFAIESQNMSGGAEATTDTGDVAYQYSIPSSGGYDGVGDLKSVTDSVTGAWSYNYDTLNRLTAATPSSGGYVGYNGCWSYDPFGNRTGENYQTTACPTTETSLTPTAKYNGNNQVTWTSVNGAVDGFTYDAAGNVLNDNANQYLYDIEGRLCAVRNLLVGSVTEYVYDAEGQRVAKGSLSSWPSACVAPTAANGFTLTNIYVLGLGGEQVSELSVSGSANTWVHTNVFASGKLLATYQGTDTYLALSDWLGTKRVEITPDSKFSTFFSLPYGNGLSTAGDAADATEHHFTGKEHDAESGNDYFGARYYASTMGRFMSPDWSAKAEPVPYAKLDNPQSLNLYAYVGNNPLIRIDKDGHYYCTGTKTQCGDLQTALNNIQKAIDGGKLNKDQQGALKKVLDMYGPKENAITDKTKVTVGFTKGDSGAVMQSGVVRVTLNYKGESSTEMAATTAHEGEHGVQEQAHGNPLSRSQEYAGEQDAYKTQSYVNKGLGVDSTYYGVWTQDGGYSQSKVNHWATVSTNIWCSNGGSNCSQ